MTDIVCFIHSYNINNCNEILNYFNEKGKNFFKNCNNIFHYNYGNKPENDIFKSINLLKAEEIETIKNIYSYSLNENKNTKICYIHTKGVTTPNNICIEDWRNYMFYFCCEQFENMVKLLDSNDTCGVDLKNDPALHYSGNFWWAKSDYIKKLCHPNNIKSPLTERHKSEFWICSSNGKHFGVHDSKIPVYERHKYRYLPENYKGQLL